MMSKLTVHDSLHWMRLSALCLLIGMCAIGRAQFLYVTNNGSITITGYNGSGGSVVIPGAIDGRAVVKVETNAFAAKSTITDINIPNSVTNIGLGAFGSCPNLTNITVDPVNQQFSSSAGVLYDKTQSTLVQFPCGVGGTFNVPQSVTSIAEQAFSSSTLLTNVVLSTNLISIGSIAFSNCKGLISMNIPHGVKSIPYAAFSNCSALANVTIPGSVTNIGAYAFTFCSLTSLDIADGTISIDTSAFAQAQKLVRVTLPKTVKSIGVFAFSSCPNLVEVYFEGDCPAVGAEPFSNVPDLKVYYGVEAAGWTSTFGGRQTVLWNAAISQIKTNFGQDTQVKLTIDGNNGLAFFLETSARLTNSIWTRISTNRTGDTPLEFNVGADLDRSFFRVRSP
jgi:hypothetical protein